MKKKSAQSTRTASEPLHVMLEPADMERYRALAGSMQLSMRQLVRFSLEGTWEFYQRSTGKLPESKSATVAADPAPTHPDLHNQIVKLMARVANLEEEVSTLAKHS